MMSLADAKKEDVSFCAVEGEVHVMKADKEAELSSTHFQWYGSLYTQQDLMRALAVVSGPQDRYEQLLHQDSFLCRADASYFNPVWRQVFNSSAVILLDTLAACPEVKAERGPTCMQCTRVDCHSRK